MLDWSALDADARRRRRAAARPNARALEPLLNAFIAIEPEAPLGSATLLDGLPYAAKDIFRTPFRHPSCGFAEGCGPPVADTSDVIERLNDAGCDLIGFTNMSELAYEPSGFNAVRGRVRNPWNSDFISGGSSSGSAAAVASGTVVAALGSDTGGSLRIPASACGVTAWKPTHGLVSVQGTMPLAHTLDTIGLLARSAEDAIAVAQVMAALPDRGTIRCVALIADATSECDPAIRRVTSDAIAVLSSLGVAVEHRRGLNLIDAIDHHALLVMQGESARAHRKWLDQAGISPVLRRRLAKGLEITDAELAGSIASREQLLSDFEEQVLGANDAALLPVMPLLTPSAAECDPDSACFAPRTLYALSRFTRFVNMLGLPAMAFPVGFDDRGMPIGMQIIGRAGSDLALLDLVRRMQSATDWHGRVPTALANLPSQGEVLS